MGKFFDKIDKGNKVIYTRTQAQRRFPHILMGIGWLIFLGFPVIGLYVVPNLIEAVPLPASWVLYLWVLGGLIIIADCILSSRINFALFIAKLRNKKYEVKSTNKGDTLTIEK